MPRRSCATSVIRRIFAAWAISMLLSLLVMGRHISGARTRLAPLSAMPGDRMGCRTALVVEPAAKWPVRCRRTRRRIGAGDTSHREGSVMRLGILVLALVAPIACMAKSETARIEIAQGKRALVTLGPESASQFTIWTGPGTGSPDVADAMTTSPRDF